MSIRALYTHFSALTIVGLPLYFAAILVSVGPGERQVSSTRLDDLSSSYWTASLKKLQKIFEEEYYVAGPAAT